MLNSHIAYNLDGTIGPQGSSSSPLNFDWQSGNGLNNQTNVTAAAIANNSVLTLRSNSVPFSNLGNNSGCLQPGMQYDLMCGTLVNAGVSGSLFPGCGIIFPGNNPGATSAGGGTNPDGTPISIPVGCITNIPNLAQIDTARTLSGSRMQEILDDSITQMVLGPERVWNNHRYLWEHIYAKNLYSQATPDVQNFFNQNQNTGIGKLAKTDAALTQRDVTTAAMANNFAPANNMEVQQQIINGVRIKLEDSTLVQPAVNNADIGALMNIANGCPETDGATFYEARALLNSLYGQQLEYTSSCQSGNQYREATDQRTSALNGVYASVYPNPSDGSFNIEVDGGENLDVEIYSMFGELVSAKHFKISNNKIQIEGLSDGVYMLKLIIDGIQNRSQKIIVTR